MHIRLTRGAILETRPLQLAGPSAKPGLDRYCPRGNHLRPRSEFSANAKGVLSRDCQACLRKLQTRTLNALPQKPQGSFPGVDIDQIHYSRGAVASWRKAIARVQSKQAKTKPRGGA